jgi:hypothetical protein
LRLCTIRGCQRGGEADPSSDQRFASRVNDRAVPEFVATPEQTVRAH